MTYTYILFYDNTCSIKIKSKRWVNEVSELTLSYSFILFAFPARSFGKGCRFITFHSLDWDVGMTLGSSSGWFEVLQDDLVRQRIPLYEVDFEKYGRYDSDYVAKATVNMNLAHVLDDGFSLSSVLMLLMFIQRVYSIQVTTVSWLTPWFCFSWDKLNWIQLWQLDFGSCSIRPFVRSFYIVFSHCVFRFFCISESLSRDQYSVLFGRATRTSWSPESGEAQGKTWKGSMRPMRFLHDKAGLLEGR